MSHKMVVVDDRCGIQADADDPTTMRTWGQVSAPDQTGDQRTFDLCPDCLKATTRFLATQPGTTS